MANADQFGVVEGLSSQELRKLTGLDSESLNHRLRRLRGQGLIRSYVPGVTNSIFRGKKVSSTYFLNLNHPGYGLDEAGAILVHCLPQSKVQKDPCGLLWRDVHGFRGAYPPLNDPETPKTVLLFLASAQQPVFDVLRIKLYRCASELLSRHWSDLALDGKGSYDWLREQIEAVFQPPAGFGEGVVEPDQVWAEILDYFCTLVVDIAKAYRTRIGAANWIGFDLVQHCILPVLQSDRAEVIALFMQPRPQEASICTVLWESPDGDLIPEDWGAETEVPLDYRFKCGLLTPPARRLLRR